MPHPYFTAFGLVSDVLQINDLLKDKICYNYKTIILYFNSKNVKIIFKII